jgi:hypothetical protein
LFYRRRYKEVDPNGWSWFSWVLKIGSFIFELYFLQLNSFWQFSTSMCISFKPRRALLSLSIHQERVASEGLTRSHRSPPNSNMSGLYCFASYNISLKPLNESSFRIGRSSCLPRWISVATIIRSWLGLSIFIALTAYKPIRSYNSEN